ncbi:autotransporter outer membrane beta-barrel domain-containing protein [Poriferisphaera corsica]|uniref:hypothetical protein n=1 Tax=Poriferisphaera corsica TaxID=2528020 RepID=UPI0011A4905D|nr:hypothetical protein [Poriferisphaera corsica]
MTGLISGHHVLIDTTIDKGHGPLLDRYNPVLSSGFFTFVNGSVLEIDDVHSQIYKNDAFSGINIGADSELRITNEATFVTSSGLLGPIIGFKTGSQKATANISSSGRFIASDLLVALTDSTDTVESLAKVNVSGANSEITTRGSLSIGVSGFSSSTSDATANTRGEVIIENGAALYATNADDGGTINVGDGANGQLVISDATAEANITNVGQSHLGTTALTSRTLSELVIDDDSAEMRMDTLNIGDQTQGHVTVSNNGTLYVDKMTIGMDKGQGSVMIESGGQLVMNTSDISQSLIVGVEGALLTNKLTLTGDNTSMQLGNPVGQMTIGQSSHGQWEVLNGASYSHVDDGSGLSTSYFFGIKGLSNNIHGQGELIVDGIGSSWTDESANIYLGFGRAGNGLAQNTGNLTVGNGATFIAKKIVAGGFTDHKYGQGKVLVTGNETTMQAATLAVGGDNSTFSITDGAEALIYDVYVAGGNQSYINKFDPSLNARVNIDGQGSVLRSNFVSIGANRAAALNVTNEGVMFASSNIFLGEGVAFDTRTSALLHAENNAYVRAINGIHAGVGEGRHVEINVLNGSYLTTNDDIRLGMATHSYAQLLVEGEGDNTNTNGFSTLRMPESGHPLIS